ncbi:MAG TPA: hypothetical protein VNU68_03495 [Verrucomicrobiae bacterium]|nr:hypothetical protein [Verrucomicrobiae bacterium]
MGVVSFQESFDVRSAQVITARDALLQKKAIELATLGQQFAAGMNGGWFSVEGCEMAANTQLVRDARALLLKEPLVLKRPSGYAKRIGASPSARSD